MRNSDPQRPRFAVGGRAKFGRNRASKSRRKTAEKSRSVSEAMRASCGGRLGARNGRPCSGCTARGSVRNSDPQRPRFAVGGRAKFGRNRASKSRRKTAEKSRSASEAMRTSCESRLGARNGRPCSGCTARGSVRNSDPQRPRFAVGGRAKFGRNRASKSRRRTTEKSRSASEAMRTRSDGRLGARNGRPCSGRTARSSVRKSDPQRPRFAVGGRAKFGRNRASKIRRKTFKKSRSVSEAMRTSCGGRLGARNGRPCSGRTARGSVRNSDPQRPRFAVGGRAKFGRNRASKSRRRTTEKSRSASEAMRTRCDGRLGARNGRPGSGCTARGSVRNSDPHRPRFAVGGRAKFDRNRASKSRRKTAEKSRSVSEAMRASCGGRLGARNGRPCSGRTARSSVRKSDPQRPRFAVGGRAKFGRNRASKIRRKTFKKSRSAPEAMRTSCGGRLGARNGRPCSGCTARGSVRNSDPHRPRFVVGGRAKFGRNRASKIRRKTFKKSRSAPEAMRTSCGGRLGARNGRPCSGCTARGSVRNSDPQRPRFGVGGRAKFGRNRASKIRQKTFKKSRSASEAMRTSCGGRLGARNGRPCSGCTARGSVRNSDPQRPRFAVGGRAKFGRNRASKIRRKTFKKSRSVSEAMRTSCGGRLGARNGRPCSGCTARGSVRNSDPQRPRFAVGGRAKFGRNRASKSRRRTTEKSRSASEAMRTRSDGRLGARNGRPGSGCTARGSVRNSDPQRPRFAVGGRAKFGRNRASKCRRKTFKISRSVLAAMRTRCDGRLGARNGRPCSGCAARGSVRNSDPQRPRFAVGGRAKFGRNRASKSRRKTAEKSRSASEAMRTSCGGRLGARNGRPCSGCTARGSVRNSDPQRPRFAVGGRAKFGRNRASKIRRKTFKKSRSVSEAMRTSCGGRLGARNGRPCSGCTARGSVRNSDPQRPRFAVGGRAKFGRNRASKIRRKTFKKSRSASEAMRTSCGGRLGARNGRPCSGRTARGSVRNSDPQRPRFAVGGRAKFGRNRASKSRRKTFKKSRSASEAMRTRCDGRLGARNGRPCSGCTARGSVRNSDPQRPRFAVGGRAKFGRNRASKIRRKTAEKSRSVSEAMRTSCGGRLGARNGRPCSGRTARGSVRNSDPQRPRFAVGGRAKFGRNRASKIRRKTFKKSRSAPEAMRTSCGGRLGARNGRPCSGCTARGSVRNSDPHRPRFVVGGRAKFGRNRASKIRRKTFKKSRSAPEAMRTSCGGRLGARNGRPCSGCTARGSVRNSDPQRPRFGVGGRAKFGRNRASKIRQKTFKKSRSASEAMRTSCGGRLGARNGRPCSGCTARGSVRNSDPQRPRFAVGGRAKFGRNRASKIRRKTFKKSRSVSEAMRTSCGGRLGARNGRPCSGCTARGSVRNSDPQRPRFAVGGRAKFGRNRASKSRRRTTEKSRSASEAMRTRSDGRLGARNGRPGSGCTARGSVRNSDPQRPRFAVGGRAKFGRNRASKCRRKTFKISRSVLAAMRTRCDGRLGARNGRPCSGCAARGSVRNSDPQRPRFAVGGRAKFGRNRASKSRRKTTEKSRSVSEAMRTSCGVRLGARIGRPCSGCTARGSVRNSDPQRPRFGVGGRAKFGRNRASKSRRKTTEKSRSVSEAMRTSCGVRLGARIGRPCSGCTARGSVRISDPQRPRFAVGGRAKFGRNRASKSRRKTFKISRSVLAAMRTGCGGRLGARNGRPCSGCTARGSVRKSDPQRPRFAVGGRAKFGRNRASKSRRKTTEKSRSV